MARNIPVSGASKDFQAECDLRTLIEAEKIKRDKSRFRAALSLRDKMKTDMEKIDGR